MIRSHPRDKICGEALASWHLGDLDSIITVASNVAAIVLKRRHLSGFDDSLFDARQPVHDLLLGSIVLLKACDTRSDTLRVYGFSPPR